MSTHSYTEDRLVEQPAIRLLAELLAAVKPALLAAGQEWQEAAVKEEREFLALSLLSPEKMVYQTPSPSCLTRSHRKAKARLS